MDFVFKVDVDTRHGLLVKVPRLLDVFRALRIKASFFVPFGPDRSGVAIRRLWERRGMVRKAFSVSPLSFYGFPTLFYGILWPAPNCAEGAEDIFGRILGEGHELGVHGYDHIEWHDRLFSKDGSFMIEQIERSTEAFKKVVGQDPEGFAAPGWQMKESCYPELKSRKYRYSSSVRGRCPFFPVSGGGDGAFLEIPSTLPTLDELYVTVEKRDPGSMVAEIVRDAWSRDVNVHTIHAELEGGIAIDVLRELVRSLSERGVDFIRMKDLAARSLSQKRDITKSRIIRKNIEGRPGPVACQV
jgi:peptidoglycan/xylan/chitin deacetylase (PgdA/CDA1 family)